MNNEWKTISFDAIAVWPTIELALRNIFSYTVKIKGPKIDEKSMHIIYTALSPPLAMGLRRINMVFKLKIIKSTQQMNGKI